jgi:predicted PurR-regulated permease PerM
MLAPLIFVFLGFDNGQIRRFFISLVPNRYFELSLTVLDRLDAAIGRYLRGTLLECFLVGLTLILGLILLGIPMGIAIAIGVVSGLLNAIPFLGTVIALVIGVGYALIAENITPLIPGLNPNNLALYVVILVIIVHVWRMLFFSLLSLATRRTFIHSWLLSRSSAARSSWVCGAYYSLFPPW